MNSAAAYEVLTFCVGLIFSKLYKITGGERKKEEKYVNSDSLVVVIARTFNSNYFYRR